MENVNMELYIIWYTFIGLMMVYLLSLPLMILWKTYQWIKNIFNNKKWWWIF